MNRPAPWRALTAGLIERRPFRVGGAVVDPVSRDAKWRGGEERLQPQTLKVLITLFSRRGEVVTRDELIQLCWEGRIVGDDVINRSILLIRHFAEKAGGFEIHTVPKTGYRLVQSGSAENSPRRHRWTATAVAAAVGIAGIAGWIWLSPRQASQGKPPAPNISVMPFTVRTNDSLARQVAQAAPDSVEHMMAESGFASVRDDPPASFNTGSGDYLLVGSVRRTTTSVDATVQLISRSDGTIAYAHDFSAPVERAADLSERIGATVVTELGWMGAAMVLDPREHLSPQTRSELLSAMTLVIEEQGGLRAYQLIRQAATSAPESAFAQLALAIETGGAISSIPVGERAEALALGRRAADRARALAPEFGDVYLPWCRLHSRVRMTECETHVRLALEIDSRSSFVPGYFSLLAHDAGLMDESLLLARQSLANDPYRPAKLQQMLRMLELSGNSGEAAQLYQKATRIWPDNDGMLGARILGAAERGDYGDLSAISAANISVPVADSLIFSALLAAQRRHDLAGSERACGSKGLSGVASGLCMNILADLGDLDRSFAIANDLYPASQAPPGEDKDRFWLAHPGEFDLAFLTGPAARSMRADPRFLTIAAKLGLLAYWRKDGLPDFCKPPQPEPVCAELRRH